MKQVTDILQFLHKGNLYPDLRMVQGGAEPEVIIDGKPVLMFSSNNYLGLACHPEVRQAAMDAIDRYGTGSDGSRLLSGNLQVHHEFEQAIAQFKGGEDAIVWPSGYAANVGVITAVTNPIKVQLRQFFRLGSVILSDELNHASIIDGCRLSGQKVVTYRHRDVEDLERKLRRYRYRRTLVITDGVFSMDGDIAPLDEISRLCRKYGALSMVDEAHATGTLGPNGKGTLELYGLQAVRDIDIVMGTCSKTLASTGGFVVGSKELIRYLRIASRSYMFSTAMTPAASASGRAALEVIGKQPQLRDNLWKNVVSLREGLSAMDFNTLSSTTQIIPILIGPDDKAIAFSRRLFARGIYAPCVRWPAVEKGKARIRFTVMATHRQEHLDRLLQACREIRSEII
jgi:8-amino-7-oxononanoate synthase